MQCFPIILTTESFFPIILEHLQDSLGNAAPGGCSLLPPLAGGNIVDRDFFTAAPGEDRTRELGRFKGTWRHHCTWLIK